MKRWIVWMLALLLLAGCGAAEQETTDPVIPEPERKPTAGGVIVQTDYTNYAPYEMPESVYTRMQEAPIENLESGDYGTLYPFQGSLLYVGSNDSYAMYGFFDETGRIVADPTYTSVEQVSYYDRSSRYVYLPLLQMTRTEYAQEKTDENEWGSWSYIDGEQLFAVASLDGSFVTECCYNGVYGMEDSVILTRDAQKNDFEIYSVDGELLLTDDDLAFADRMEEYACYTMQRGDGMILVPLDDGLYYMNLDGELVLGPYAKAECFRNGRAIVAVDDTTVGLIDEAGNWILRLNCSDIYEFMALDDGRYAWLDREHQMIYVYDRDGQEVFQTKGVSIVACSYGYCCSMDGWDVFLDEQGKELSQPSGDGWTMCWGTPVVCRQGDNSDGINRLEVRNMDNGAEKTFLSASTFSPIYVDIMDGLTSSQLAYYKIMDYTMESGSTAFLIDTSLNEVMDLGEGYTRALQDAVTGKEYLAVVDGALATVYDTSLNQIGVFPQTALEVRNDHILYRDDYGFHCVDLDGNVLFCYPLLLSQGD
jgi:hypothetical protein